MQKGGYINEFTIVDDARAGKIVVELNGRLNKCGVISPRFDLPVRRFENFVNSILPSRQFGVVIISTNEGIMTHTEAFSRQIGGKVIGYFYWAKLLEDALASYMTIPSHCEKQAAFLIDRW